MKASRVSVARTNALDSRFTPGGIQSIPSHLSTDRSLSYRFCVSLCTISLLLSSLGYSVCLPCALLTKLCLMENGILVFAFLFGKHCILSTIVVMFFALSFMELNIVRMVGYSNDQSYSH